MIEILLKCVEIVFVILPKKTVKKISSTILKKRTAIFLLLFLVLLIRFYPKIEHVFFKFKWNYFFCSDNAITISNTMKDLLRTCGHGANLTRVVIGEEKNSGQPKLIIDLSYSCNKLESESKDCVLESKSLNPKYNLFSQGILVDQNISNLIDSDSFEFGGNSYSFKEGDVFNIKLLNEDHSETYQAMELKAKAPSINLVLKNMNRPVKEMGVIKIRHNIFKDPVYLFFLSFWDSETMKSEKLCDYNTVLKEVSMKQKWILEK